MHHRSRIILITYFLTILSACQFVNTSDSSTLPDSETDFAVADTASITKIFLADAGDRQVLLERKSKDHWTVETDYKARPDAINTLLKTIKRLRVKRPVSHSAMNNVVTELAAKHTKVEIYTKNSNKPAKVYYIGGVTLDNRSNHMLLEGAENPYVVHIPGFSGYLSVRYFLDKEEWRDRSVFKLKPKDIAFIEVNYPDKPEDSFRISPKNLESYSISRLDGSSSSNVAIDTKAAYDYLSFYRNLNLESYVNDYSFREEIKDFKPLAQIGVQPKKGDLKTMVIYRMPVNKRSKGRVTAGGEVKEYDPDRFYAYINDGKDFIVIQNYVFGKVLRDYDYFLK